jgi:hypothetical protein
LTRGSTQQHAFAGGDCAADRIFGAANVYPFKAGETRMDFWSHYTPDGRISTTDAALWLAFGIAFLLGLVAGALLEAGFR